MTKASDNEFPSVLFDEQASAPATPAANDWRLFFKSDGLYHVDDAGGVTGPLVTAAGSHGAWTTFTPTLTATTTNPTVGNGTLTGRYKSLDSKTYALQMSWIFGSTSNAGSGNYSFALPSGLTSGALEQLLTGILIDSGTAEYLCTGRITASSTTVLRVVAETDTSVDHNSPFVWATGDHLELTGIIEVA